MVAATPAREALSACTTPPGTKGSRAVRISFRACSSRRAPRPWKPRPWLHRTCVGFGMPELSRCRRAAGARPGPTCHRRQGSTGRPARAGTRSPTARGPAAPVPRRAGTGRNALPPARATRGGTHERGDPPGVLPSGRPCTGCLELAGRVGFEPTGACAPSDFKSLAFNRSAISPSSGGERGSRRQPPVTARWAHRQCCHTRSTIRRNCGCGRTRAVRSGQTRCGTSARRSGSRR